MPFEERIAWVRENEERILDAALDPLDGQRAWTEADSPYCALAACFEWAGYKMAGEDFVSHLPIALDVTQKQTEERMTPLREILKFYRDGLLRIRDSTFRTAMTLRGVADATLGTAPHEL